MAVIASRNRTTAFVLGRVTGDVFVCLDRGQEQVQAVQPHVFVFPGCIVG
jgi:hypothetical protein